MAKSSTPSTKTTDSYVSQPILFLFGPTGVGKTALIEQQFSQGFSVINADSMQVYKHVNIGSAKPEQTMLDAVTHYLINVREPWQQFTVGDFIKEADDACLASFQQNLIPVISGGTAYYFKHFLYGLSDAPSSDESSRTAVAALLERNGQAWCYEYLQSVDPVSAQKIHPSDAYRLTRALEVYYASGKPRSAFSIPTIPRMDMNPLIIGLARNRDELAQRIEKRVEIMFAQGLVDEIRALIRMGATEDWPAMKGIGYREFFEARNFGESSLIGVAQQIIKNSKAYAKRQMTFFRSYSQAHWVHPDDTETVTKLVDSYLRKIHNRA